MSISIVFANKVTFPVKGELLDESGKAAPFSFTLTARRLDQAGITALAADVDRPIADVFAELVTGWEGPQDENGLQVPYSEDGLRQLLRVPGLAALVLQAYLANVGARAKN